MRTRISFLPFLGLLLLAVPAPAQERAQADPGLVATATAPPWQGTRGSRAGSSSRGGSSRGSFGSSSRSSGGGFTSRSSGSGFQGSSSRSSGTSSYRSQGSSSRSIPRSTPSSGSSRVVPRSSTPPRSTGSVSRIPPLDSSRSSSTRVDSRGISGRTTSTGSSSSFGSGRDIYTRRGESGPPVSTSGASGAGQPPVSGSSRNDSVRYPTAGSTAGTSAGSGIDGNRTTGSIIDLSGTGVGRTRVRFPAPYRPAGSASDLTPRRVGGDVGASSLDGGDAGTGRAVDRYRVGALGRVGADATGNTGSADRGSGPARPDWWASGQRDVRGAAGTGDTGARGAPGRLDYGRGPIQRLAPPARTRSVGAPAGGPVTPPHAGVGRRDVRSTGVGGPANGAGVGRGLPRETELRGLTRLQATDPTAARRVRLAGESLGRASALGLDAGIGAVGGIGGVVPGGYHGDHHGGHHGHHDHDGYYAPWGFCYYGGHWSFGLSFGWNWYWGDCWWYWPTYFSCYYPWWYWYERPYYASYPVVYSTVVYRTVYEDTYAQAPPAESADADVGEAAAPDAGRVPASNTLSIAAERYLTLGDRAFREGRWADAVQLYARAVELAPDQGALYLVLSDALFAAGDYHYAAYAARKALELEPVLIDQPVDKHGFYTDPSEFDRQLATLETYLVDHPTDRDARLVLALNDLLGGRPAAAVDLYAAGAAPASALVLDDAASTILAVAKRTQYGGK